MNQKFNTTIFPIRSLLLNFLSRILLTENLGDFDPTLSKGPHSMSLGLDGKYYVTNTNDTSIGVFNPDIDKWEKWDRDIIEEIAKVDYAFLDATFYDGQELNNRDISEIPHPFIIESMELFRDLPPNEKAKVHFIHLNHTNPGLDFESEQSKAVLDAGFRLARIGQRVRL